MNKIDFDKLPPCLAMLKSKEVRHDNPVKGAQVNVDCLGVPDEDFFGEDSEGENLDSENKCEGKCAKSYREDCKPDIE